MTDSLHSFLRTRRSIRHFKADPVPKPLIEHILETATYAPSAHNKQPWRFIVLTEASTRTHLAQAIAGKFQTDMTADGTPETEIVARIERTLHRANEAAVIIVLCRDVNDDKPQLDETRQHAEALMGVQSVAMVGLQLLLAAHAEGLGGVWICWPLFAPEATRAALELPPEWEPQGMIFLGYPAEEPDTPERMVLSDIVRHI